MDMIKTESFELAIYTKGDPKAAKLAMVLPGRLDTKDYAHMSELVHFLASHGYYAVSFDPPGIWESPGSINIYTTTNYLKAVEELVNYFGNRPTILLGHSRGGSVAILSATNPAVTAIVCIMANYGVPTPPSAEAEQQGYELERQVLPPGTTISKERKEFRLPMSYFQDGRRYNPAEALKECTKPKLLIYGTRDRYTDPKLVKDLYKLMPEPKMICEVDSKHHYRTHPEIIEKVNTVVSEFLDKYSL